MRRRLLVSCLVVLSAACSAPAPNLDQEAAAVRAALEGYRTAIQQNRADGLRAVWDTTAAARAYMWDSREALRGWAAIEPELRDWIATSDSIRVTLRDVSVYVEPSGHGAWVTYIEDGTAKGRAGPETWTGIRATLGFAKENGAWRIVQAHWSFPTRADSTAKK